MRTISCGRPDAVSRQEGRRRSPICRVVMCRAALQQPKTKEALKDPARIGARAAVSVEVQVGVYPFPSCIPAAIAFMMKPCTQCNPLRKRGFPSQDYGGSLSLENYMRLPVEQYYELDPALIVPRQGNRFGLMVPRVHVGHLLPGCL